MARAPYLPRVPKGLLFPLSRGVSQDPSRDNTVGMLPPVPQLVITTTSLPAATQFNPYNQSLAATGGVTPYTWSLSAGSLPSGLSLSSSGVISGTLGQSSSSSFTVKVTDHVGTTATQPLTLTVNLATVNGQDSGPNGQNLTIPSSGVTAVASPAGTAFNQAMQLTVDDTIVQGPAGTTNAQGAVTGSAFTAEFIFSSSVNNTGLLGRDGEWYVYIDSSSNINFSWNGTGFGTTAITLGNEYAVAMTWDGTTVRAFLNGSLIGSITTSVAPTPTDTSLSLIEIPGTFQGLAGVTLDEVRISDTARYTSSYTPATAPFTSDSNTGCLYHLDAVQV